VVGDCLAENCSLSRALIESSGATMVGVADREGEGSAEEDAPKCSTVAPHPVPSSGAGDCAARVWDERGVGNGEGEVGEGGFCLSLPPRAGPGAACSAPRSCTFPCPALARLLRASTSVL
jgi:hypothetical protein